MSLMRPFSSIRDDIDRMFREMEREFLTPIRGRGGYAEPGTTDISTVWAPAIDMVEENNNILLKVQVPGIRPEDLDIEVENNTVTLSGESRQREEETKGNVYRQEICYGRFYRRVPLPTEVQADKAKANFEHGLLTISLPKSEETRRHKIKVGGGGSK
jgi:HSP20 family protein